MRLRAKRLIAASGIFSFCLGAPGWSTKAEAAGVQARFGVDSPSAGPFPSNLFTVRDASQNTGLRVNLPKPDCAIRVSDCRNIDVINTLDGFNLQPRLAIPFDGPIDLTSILRLSIFLVNLGSSQLGASSYGEITALNQVVWEPTTNTLYAESDALLEQHTRYGLIVTRAVRDGQGRSVKASREFKHFLEGKSHLLRNNTALQEYRRQIFEAIDAARFHPRFVVAASVFTTQSATAVLEKIRNQIKANTPEPVDFLLGPGGIRTIFALNNVSSMSLNLQTGTAPVFTSVPAGFLSLLLSTLRAIPGVVGTLAYGKYVSPNYEATGEFIPPIGTLTGEPSVQSENEIYFTLALPSGTPPPNGWPVAIFGHGGEVSKDLRLFLFAAELAERGIATIGINAVGHGNGPLGTLTVNQTVGGAVTFLAGGRGIDQDGNGTIGADEGLRAAPPRGLVNNRDGFQQTAVDLMQLVRVIEVGMDVDGDTVPDLDPSRIYYFGQSLGGMYGTLFLAVEPNVQAGVPNVPGGPLIEFARLSPNSRPAVGVALHANIPALDNLPSTPGPVFNFNENMPLRDQPPVINAVTGALDIQRVFEWSEWVTQAGNPVAYAPHLRKVPLVGMQPKDIIVQFVKGDKTVPNPTATALIRAGDLADRATYYRNDLAFADPVRNPTGVEVPKNPHAFLSINSIFPLNPNSPFFFPALGDVGAGARRQIAEFFASDGTSIIDPDGAGPLFEVPIAEPLPEELNFIP